MLKVNTNKSDFKALLKDKAYYYVDKTSFIKEFISIEESEFSINLILRPRRFGKSLNQSMLKYFFDIDEKDSAFIFEGLEVSKDKEFCAKFQNKFPVIF